MRPTDPSAQTTDDVLDAQIQAALLGEQHDPSITDAERAYCWIVTVLGGRPRLLIDRVRREVQIYHPRLRSEDAARVERAHRAFEQLAQQVAASPDALSPTDIAGLATLRLASMLWEPVASKRDRAAAIASCLGMGLIVRPMQLRAAGFALSIAATAADSLRHALANWTKWFDAVIAPARSMAGPMGFRAGCAYVAAGWKHASDAVQASQRKRISDLVKSHERYCEPGDVDGALMAALHDGASLEGLIREGRDGTVLMRELVAGSIIRTSMATLSEQSASQEEVGAGLDEPTPLEHAGEMLAAREARDAAQVRDLRELREVLDEFARERLRLKVRSHARAIRAVRRQLVALLAGEKSQKEAAEEAGCAESKISEALAGEVDALRADPRLQRFLER